MVTFLQKLQATDRFQFTMDGDLPTTVVTEEHLSVLEHGTTVVMNVVFVEPRQQHANIVKCPLCRQWIPLRKGNSERGLW